MTVDKFIKGRIILLSPVINNGDHVRKMIALIEHHDNSKNVGESSIESVTQRFKEISNKYNYPETNKLYAFKKGLRKFMPITDARKIIAGKFIDVSENVKESEIEALKNLPILLACLYEENSRKRVKLTFEQKVELIKKQDVNKLYSVILFFCQVTENLLPAIATYLQEVQKELADIGNDLQLSGDGVPR